jgi:hypothetical protein
MVKRAWCIEQTFLADIKAPMPKKLLHRDEKYIPVIIMAKFPKQIHKRSDAAFAILELPTSENSDGSHMWLLRGLRGRTH